jgi:hypothetical protein
MAKRAVKRAPAKRASAKKQEQPVNQSEKALKNLAVGSPLEHPDAIHLQNVQNLPTELQSIITDLQNNQHDPAQLFPGIIERIDQVRATVTRILQGNHTAPPIAADQPHQAITSHSSPTSEGLDTGSSRYSTRQARGQQARRADQPRNNPPQAPLREPPPQTPPATPEPGAHV